MNKLIEKAREALEFSYSPYSKFSVGAAVLCDDGSIFSGCNIENASYGATVCAERVAMWKAVSEGHRDMKAIAIVCKADQFPMPCGMCRQVMAEFMPDGDVYVVRNDEVKCFKVSELIPHSFELEN